MSKLYDNDPNDPNLRRGNEKFSFLNGDTYEGEYKLHLIKTFLVKDGQGTYTMNDFNVYTGKWENDNFSGDNFVIRYNNGTRYEGEINAQGQMSGQGIYIFPDDSSIHATWFENKPISDITYHEPLGYVWITESITDDTISFVPKNHFWTELCQATLDDMPTPAPSTSTLSTKDNTDQ